MFDKINTEEINKEGTKMVNQYYAKGDLLCSKLHRKTHKCRSAKQAKDLADRMNKSTNNYKMAIS